MTEGPYKLPEGWRWVRLGEVISYANGVWGKPKSNGVPVLRSTNFTDDGELSFEDVATVELSPKQIAKALLRHGDILLERSGGGPNKPVGRVCLFKVRDVNTFFCFSNFLTVLRVTNRDVDSEYLYHFLRWFHISGRTEMLQTQTTNIRNLRFKEYLETRIPLPPLSEQRRIVARIEELMARVREARRLRQEAQEDAERLWQSVLADTFPRPGSDLPQGWRWVRLGEVCQHRTGIWGPEASDPAQGFPIVRSTEIDGFLIRPQAASVRVVRPGQVDSYKLETGDILVNKSSGSPHLVGWPAIFEDPQDGRAYLFSNFMLRLRSDRCSLEPWFLLYYLHSPIARSIYLGAQDTTSGLRNLRVREFMAQPIPLPPLSEQRRIVARLEAVRERVQALKRAQEETKARLKDLERSILDKAFRGEL